MNLRIPWFPKAIDLQVDGIELVYLSADGELMVTIRQLDEQLTERPKQCLSIGTEMLPN
jgi:hypothetical protein